MKLLIEALTKFSCGLLLVGLLSSWYMGRQHSDISGELEDSAWLALSGQWENARKTADRAREQWEENWAFRAAFADHKPMEEIDAMFAELTVLGAAGERTDFARVCSALSRQVESMGNAQKLSWWNIL